MPLIIIPHSAEFSRRKIFEDLQFSQNVAGRIFMDAVNVTPNVHNYKKNFAHKFFEVGGRSLKNVKTFLRLGNLTLYNNSTLHVQLPCNQAEVYVFH